MTQTRQEVNAERRRRLKEDPEYAASVKKGKAEWYQRNKERSAVKAELVREECRSISREAMTPCADCGAFDIRYMDWHHTDPSTKVRGINEWICARSKKGVREEIKKCICLCSNCHRIRHADQRIGL